MRGPAWNGRFLKVFPLLLIALLSAGCLQLDLQIEMEDDGGATLTERIWLSRALLELNSDLQHHLLRESALERMKIMGKGMTLVNHKVNKLGDGSAESLAVFHIPVIEDLRLPNPFLQDGRPAPMVRFEFRPIYSSPSRPGEVGNVSVRLVPTESPADSNVGSESTAPQAASPRELEVFRKLQPVFADLMRDFAVRVTLIVPNQPTKSGRPAGPLRIRLLSFTGADLDRNGAPFLENEEAMLALLQLRLNDPSILTHTAQFPRNERVPVHRGSNPYGSTHFQIRPTRSLFQKYFAGRSRSEGGDQ